MFCQMLDRVSLDTVQQASQHQADQPLASFDYSAADKTLQRGLFREIKTCTHRSVPGFVDKHSDVTKWVDHQKKALDSVLMQHDGTRWQNFPNDCSEEAVLEWLLSLQDALGGVQQVLSELRGHVDFKHYKRQTCMVFQRPGQESGNLDFRSVVVVVGKHEAGTHPADFRMALVQLTKQIQNIFAEQPLRRFVHAFTIKQAMMELWVFDRSGPYSSGEFDIHPEQDKFARAFVAYATMDDAAMGLNIYTEEQQGHRNINVKYFDNNHIRTALNKPLVRQRGVVCRGTTCFLTALGVAKFSWLSDKQPSEVNLLQLASERGVRGVVTFVGHCEIASISELRQGLEFSNGTRYPFRENTDNNRPGKVSRSWTSGPRKRLKLSANTSSSIQACAQESLYKNRILTCLITSPAGRAIDDFRTIRELLEALRDAIRAHQSLYVDGEFSIAIFHQTTSL